MFKTLQFYHNKKNFVCLKNCIIFLFKRFKKYMDIIDINKIMGYINEYDTHSVPF